MINPILGQKILIVSVAIGVFILAWLFSQPVLPQSEGANDYEECRALISSGAPLDQSVNNPPIFQSFSEQRLTVGTEHRLKLNVCDKENMVPGTIAENLPEGAALEDNFDGTRSFVWTPQTEGITNVTFTAYDEVDRDIRTSTTVRFVVAAGSSNAPPELPEFANITGRVGELLSFVVAPIDPDGDVPGVFVTGSPAGSSFNDNLNGTRTFRWVPDGTGEVEIVFVATDARDSELHTLRKVTLTIEGEAIENRPPYIEPIADQIIAVGETLVFIVSPIDPDGTTPVLTAENLPDDATFVANEDKTWTYTWEPTSGDVGKRTLSFTAIDVSDESLSSTQTVMIEVIQGEIIDTTPPVITLLGDNPLELAVGDEFIDPGATAFDDVDGDLTENIIVGGDLVDSNTVDTYLISYDVQDAAGNRAEQLRRSVVVMNRDDGIDDGILDTEPVPSDTSPIENTKGVQALIDDGAIYLLTDVSDSTELQIEAAPDFSGSDMSAAVGSAFFRFHFDETKSEPQVVVDTTRAVTDVFACSLEENVCVSIAFNSEDDGQYMFDVENSYFYALEADGNGR